MACDASLGRPSTQQRPAQHYQQRMCPCQCRQQLPHLAAKRHKCGHCVGLAAARHLLRLLRLYHLRFGRRERQAAMWGERRTGMAGTLQGARSTQGVAGGPAWQKPRFKRKVTLEQGREHTPAGTPQTPPPRCGPGPWSPTCAAADGGWEKASLLVRSRQFLNVHKFIVRWAPPHGPTKRAGPCPLHAPAAPRRWGRGAPG